MKKQCLISLFLSICLLLGLTACGSAETMDDGSATPVTAPENIQITASAARAVETESYECADFPMTIPKGMDCHQRRREYLSQHPRVRSGTASAADVRPAQGRHPAAQPGGQSGVGEELQHGKRAGGRAGKPVHRGLLSDVLTVYGLRHAGRIELCGLHIPDF